MQVSALHHLNRLVRTRFRVNLFRRATLTGDKSEEHKMKLRSLLLALPLVLGAGSVFADSTTTTDTKKSDPVMGTTESTSSTRHNDSLSGSSSEKRDTTRQNPDGSVSTESSKTTNKPN